MNTARLTLPIRITLLSLVITLSGVVTIALIAYTYSDTMLEREELRALEQKSEREAAAIRQKFETILQDAHFLNQSDPVKGIARALQNEGYDEEENMTLFLWKKRLATLFTTVMAQRNLYSQMRLIRATPKGPEMVRVERIDDQIITTPPDKLQNKGHRDYFKAGLKLKPGEFYISRISLNREHNQITFPPTPMVRVVMPVFDRNNHLFALLVINANLLRIARNLLNPPRGLFYFLANEKGDYLIHPDDKKAMAFEYGRTTRLQQDYPRLEKVITRLRQRDHAPENLIFSLPEQGIGLALNVVRYYPGHPDRFLIVGGVEGLSALKEKSVTLRNQLLVLVLITSGVLALLTFFLVRRLIEPLQMLNRAVESVKQGDLDVDIPVQGHDEIASLARSFEEMLERLTESQKALKEANLSLEAEVASRTEELTQAKHFLEAQNRQLTEALEQAKAADKAKSRFLAMMSHEIRTPLNGILGLTELALQQPDLPPRLRDNLQAVHDSGRTLLTILNDVLDFSKMEAGELKLHPQPTDIHRLLEQVLRLYADMADSKGLALFLHPPALLRHEVVVDSDRLRQILMNLMSNAIKFTEQGHVILRARLIHQNDEQATLCFEVEDTGSGIPDEQRQRLFKEFSQLDDSYARKHGGTGLGLSIARRLTELMAGEIGVNSTVGQGSTFHVTLTLKKHNPLPDHPARWLTQAASPELILWSEHPIQRAIWQTVLPEFGFRIRLLEALSQAAPDEQGTLLIDLSDPERLAQTGWLEQAARRCVLLTRADMPPLCPQQLNRPLLYSHLFTTLKRLWQLDDQQDTTAPQQTEADSTGQDTDTKRLRVLLAEDVPVNQKVAIGMLNRLGVTDITCAENGREALQHYRCGAYDLVLMDLQMPEMDGYQALRAIRDHEKTHHCAPTPIVALTAHALQEEHDHVMAAGFDGMLTKPLSLEALRDRLARLPHHNAQKPLRDDNLLRQLAEQVGDTDVVIKLFLDELDGYCDKLKAALAQNDAHALRELAHRLKGSSRNLGALRLGDACERLEKAVRHTHQTDELTAQVNELCRLIEMTQHAYGKDTDA